MRTVSVIVPTHNRKESLERAIRSLARQTYPPEDMEVIVVDDGSIDGTEAIAQESYPFPLVMVRQAHAGATTARNAGARVAQGRFLIFMDDDIELGEGAIDALVEAVACSPMTIALGVLVTTPPGPVAAAASQSKARCSPKSAAGDDVPFQECMTGLLAVPRKDFEQIGMFEDPTGGWPNWDDVDFGYRAHRAGYRFRRPRAALARHWDCAASDIEASCERWYRASLAAPRLFRKHPELVAYIPMYRDKTAIQWGTDSSGLICRKVARRLLSAAPVTWALSVCLGIVERLQRGRWLAVHLRRWIVGAHVFRGYREGSARLHLAPSSGEPQANDLQEPPALA